MQLQLDPLPGELVHEVLQCLAGPDVVCSQILASIMCSLSKVLTVTPSANVPDSLCSCFLPTVQLAGAEAVAHFVYGLQSLRHLPSGVIRHTMALAMMRRMLHLCSVEGQQPSLQDILGCLRSAEVGCLRGGCEQANCSPAEGEGADYRNLGSHSFEPGCHGTSADAQTWRWSEGHSCHAYA